MADIFTTNQGWNQQATGDTNWGQTLNTIIGDLDALGAIGPLSVRQAELPTSSSLNVRIAAGSFRKSDGTTVAYGGSTGVTMTASQTNYVYLTDAGVLTVNTTGFPASTNCVPLAIVVAGSATITSVTDARLAWISFGAQLAIFANQSANVVFAGPTSGGAAAPTFRALVNADLSGTNAALTTAVAIFAGGFGVFRRVPGSYPYTVVAGDGWIEVDSTAARTINLPAASSFSAGQCLTVLDGNGHAGSNAISVARAGSDTINGSASAQSISSNFGWLELYSDGVSNWHALAPGSGGGGGSVSSVANSDGTLTISPTSGSVVASLNPAHSNTWTVAQTFAPTSTSAIPIVANAPSGTTVPAFEVQINGTNCLWVNNKGSVIAASGAGALATNATDGFFYGPSCAGIPTGTPTAETGAVPLVVDTSDGRLYGYYGGAWNNLTPTAASLTINTSVITGGTPGYVLYNNGGTVGNEQFVPCANGGTGISTAAASNGQLLIGNGSGLSLATLTQGAGMTITNSAGGITLASSTALPTTVPGAYPYTILSTDAVVLVDTTSAARSVTLPSAISVGAGHVVVIKDAKGGANTHNITVSTSLTQTIDGQTSATITTSFEPMWVVSDGANWSRLEMPAQKQQGTSFQFIGGPVAVGSLAPTQTTYTGTASMTAGASSGVALVNNTSGGAITLTLPNAGMFGIGGNGSFLTIKDIGGNAATHTITIQRAGSDLIDGSSSSLTITSNYGVIRLLCDDSSNWYTV